MAVALLILACFAGLALIPVGLPGTWLMLVAALVYNWLVTPAAFGWWTLSGVLALATLAEVLEFTIAKKYTEKSGGSSRAGWGAMLGGLLGAFAGVPIPVLGSVIGAFGGAFLGALVMEWTVRPDDRDGVVQVAKGALIGRVVATAAKLGAGIGIAAWLVIVALASG